MQLCRSIREHNDSLKATVRQKLQTLQTFNERRRMFRRSNSAQNGLLNTDNSKSLGKFCESHLKLLTWLRSQQKDESQNHEGKRTLAKPHSTAARLISQMTVTGSWPCARGKMQYNNKKGDNLKIWILQWFKFQSKTMFTLSEMSISSQMAIDSEGEIWHSIKTSSGSANVKALSPS